MYEEVFLPSNIQNTFQGILKFNFFWGDAWQKRCSQKASRGCGKGPGEKGAVLAVDALLGVARTLLYERNKVPKTQMSMNSLLQAGDASVPTGQ